MPEGGDLEMALEARGRLARIRVSDRGTGLSAAALRAAFQPFWTTKERGSGLGLVLARRIVEAHGGTIAIANREGGGAEAVVDLPMRDEEKEAPAPAGSRDDAPAPAGSRDGAPSPGDDRKEIP
jgi:signal transduction histidine kinase